MSLTPPLPALDPLGATQVASHPGGGHLAASQLTGNLAQEAGSTVGTGPALAIAAGAIALLLTLIMVLKMQPLLALVVVSLVSALLLGVPVGEVMDTLYTGLGETLAEVALLVAFGAMLGRMLEVSGGAGVLARSLVHRFGERNAPLALGVAGLLFAFPIFYDAGLIIFLPVVFSVARQLGGSVLRYGLPVAGAFAAMHVFVPPHPGPVAAASLLGADIGLLVLIGIGVAIPAWLVAGQLVGRRMGDRIYLPVPAVSAGGEGAGTPPPPRMSTVLAMLLLPLVLILFNTGLETLGEAGVVDTAVPAVQVAQLVGESPIALLIAVLLASLVLGRMRGMRLSEIEYQLTDCLGPIAVVIYRRWWDVRRGVGGRRRRSGVGGRTAEPRGAAAARRVLDRRGDAGGTGFGDGRADHGVRVHRSRRAGDFGLVRAGVVFDRHRDRRRRHDVLARQRFRLLAYQPTARDGCADGAADLDGDADADRLHRLRARVRDMAVGRGADLVRAAIAEVPARRSPGSVEHLTQRRCGGARRRAAAGLIQGFVHGRVRMA